MVDPDDFAFDAANVDPQVLRGPDNAAVRLRQRRVQGEFAQVVQKPGTEGRGGIDPAADVRRELLGGTGDGDAVPPEATAAEGTVVALAGFVEHPHDA